MVNIIFPVNNKGGVGKTSLLTDLCATLAQRHRLGIIDTDYQASLGSTLLKDSAFGLNLGLQDYSFYEQLDAKTVTLLDAVTFNASNVFGHLEL